MNRNYLILKPESVRNDNYTIRMLSGNRISGFLPFQEKWLDGDCRYYYDVTSKQPLGRILEYRNLKGRELKTFLTSLIFSIRQMERFLLDEGQLCLEPDFIYMEPEHFRCELVLVPGEYGDFVSEFRKLSQYLLDHVNQNDRDAVVLAFSVFKECQKINFGIEDIENCVGKISGIEQEKEEQEDKKEETPFPVTEERKSPSMDRIQDFLYAREEGVQEKPEEQKEKAEPKIQVGFLWIPILCIMLFVPVALFLRTGISGLVRWKWYLGGIEVSLSIIAVNVYIVGKKYKKYTIDTDESEELEEPFWEEYLYKQEEMEMGNGSTHEPEVQEEEMQTMLLTPQAVSSKGRSLVPVKGGEEISVPYFPFIIGKSEGISDFCLNKAGVSRLHVKIEEKEDGYQVTDLNSTNGTRVDGRLMNANETCPLSIGSELAIAEERFIFR